MEIRIPPMQDDSIRKMLQAITDDEEQMSILVSVAQGNPGAATAIKAMYEVNADRAEWCLDRCLDRGITGPMLWLLFKDVCGQDVAAVLKIVELGDAVDALEALPYSGYRRPEGSKHE